MKREGKDPLQIGAKLISPRGVINNHQMIANDANLVDKYLSTQAQEIAHYDEIFKIQGEKCVMACQTISNGLSLSLRNLEYHTPDILRVSLEREPLYNRVMQTMKIKWLGLKLSPSLLLGMGVGKYQAKEDKEWEEADVIFPISSS